MVDGVRGSQEHQVRALLVRLLPVTEALSKVCVSVPCRDGWCKHFGFPEGVSPLMRWAVNVAYEVLVLGWDMNHSGELGAFQSAVESWRALGVIR